VSTLQALGWLLKRVARIGHSACDLHSNIVRVFVFPKAYDDPARLPQRRIRLEVSLRVANDLRRPIVRVGRRTRVVLRTAMPVTTVDEHSNLEAREKKVCRPPKCLHWPRIDLVSETEGVDAAPYLHLRPGPCAYVRPHALSRTVA
jgi:hypothetical protein